MSAIRRVFRRLLSVLRADRSEDDLAREIEAHLRLLEDKFLAQGMSAEDARFAARRAFGGVEQAKERQRDTRSFRWLDDSRLDFKLGARMLIKYPGLSLVGGVAMAVAIAVSASSVAFFYSTLYPTLPLPEGERVVALENWDLEVNNEERQSLHDFVSWRDELTSFADIAAFRTIGRNLIVSGGVAEPIRIAEITASGFAVARVPPLLGRILVEQDHLEGAARVLVIGYDVWTTRFGSNAAVVGQHVRIGNTPHTVVGVMPEGFAFPVNHSYWVPLRVDPSPYRRGMGPEIFIFGRLARAVTFEQAQAELAAIGMRSAAAFPETHAQLRPRVLPYTYPVSDIQDVRLWEVGLMQAMVSMLLVVVAVNVAILIYARIATRQGEIAVRSALGASRRRIVGQLFIEALVLSGAAAALGLAIAKVIVGQGHLIMELETGSPPFWMDYALPPVAVVYVVGLTVMAAIIAGVVPALQATGRGVQSALRQLSGSTGIQLGRTWTVLIVAQVALAVAALPVAAAMGWHEIRDATTRPTFAAEQFLTAGLALDSEPPPGTDPADWQRESGARFARLQHDFLARLEAEPWVSDVTIAMALPGNGSRARIEVEDASPPPGSNGHLVESNRVDLDFFAAFDTPILTGRRFTAGDLDSASASRGVIVTRRFVEQILGGQHALGRRVRYLEGEGANPGAVKAGRWYEIVGVAGDLHANAIDPGLAAAEIYHPLAAAELRQVNIVVRVNGGTAASYVQRLREISAAIDPTLRLRTRPLLESYRQQDVALRLVTLLVTLVTGSVLLLSAAGVYALMSFTVAQRKKEIAIRAALGAEPHRLLRSIFFRAAGQLAIGLGVGVAAVVLLDLLREGELLEGKGTILLPIIAVLMLAAGLIAAAGPARRGLRIQPTEALREQ